jgi:hypothetical protein
MKIAKFVKNMVPSLRKDRVLEEINLSQKMLTIVIPTYEGMADMFKNRRMASKDAMRMEKHFDRQVSRLKYRGSMMSIIHQVLINHQDTLKRIESLLVDELNKEETKEMLTYFKANLIQSVQLSRFFLTYAQTLSNFIMVAETATLTDDAGYVGKSLNRKQLQWLFDNWLHFVHLTVMFGEEKDKLVKKFEDIPEYLVRPDMEDISSEVVEKGRNIDVLKAGFIPAKLNVIFFIRMAIEDYRESQYEAAKARKKLCELRMLQFKNKLASPDENHAKIQQQIEYYEKETMLLERSISKYEEG